MNTSLLRSRWQSLPEREIRQLQTEKLRRYLHDVVLPFSPFYGPLLREHNFDPSSVRSLDDLQRIPFTDKGDLLNTTGHPQRAREFVLTPDPRVLAARPSTILRALTHGRARVQQELEAEFRPIFMTSTTGRSADPIPFLFTRHDLDNLAVTGRRTFEVCGARSDMRLLNMFPYAPHLAFWQTHYGGEAFGVFVASSGGGKVAGTEGQLRFIRKIQPDVLIGMPTFVYHVLHQAAEAQMVAVFLHHRARHAHLQLRRRRLEDAALETVRAVELAHDVDVDQVQHQVLELGVLLRELGGGDVDGSGRGRLRGDVGHRILMNRRSAGNPARCRR